MFIKIFQKGEEQMKKKFLIVSLATMLCLVSLTTVNAAPAESPAPAVYTTAATPTDFALMKQLFNAEEYAEMYPDVVAALGTGEDALWEHFVTHGLSEGRALSKRFNVFAYIAAYKDLRDAFGNDLVAYYVHYVNHGLQEKRELITIDKVIAAGFSITGIRGQLIAEPPVADNDSSEPASVPVSTPAPTSAPAPTATPAPTSTPTPTATPTATPAPEPPIEPTAVPTSAPAPTATPAPEPPIEPTAVPTNS